MPMGWQEVGRKEEYREYNLDGNIYRNDDKAVDDSEPKNSIIHRRE
jgi:hypothetical protein